MRIAELQSDEAEYPSVWSAVTPLAVAGFIALLALPVVPVFAVLAYAVGFTFAAWIRIDVAITVMMFGVPWLQDIIPGLPVHISAGEGHLFLLALMLGLKLFGGRSQRMTLPWILPSVLVYLGVCLLSSLLEWRGAVALVSIAQMMLYLVLAPVVMSKAIRRPEDFLPGLLAYMISCAVVGVAIITGGVQYVFGLHKNGAGASLAAAVTIGVVLLLTVQDRPKYRVAAIILLVVNSAGLLASLSRGAWLAALAGTCLVLLMRREWKRSIAIASLVAPVLLVLWLTLPQADREYALSFDPSERRNIQTRINNAEFAIDLFESAPIFGVGTGLRKQFDSTNIVLSTAAETGLLGVLAFGWLQVSALRRPAWIARRLPFDSLWQLAPLVAVGVIAGRLAHGMVDHYWSRGALLIGWCAIGWVTVAQTWLARSDTTDLDSQEIIP